MNSFLLSIVSVDRLCYEGMAVACHVCDPSGWRTFEAHHEPFVSVLVPCVVSVLEEGGGRFSIEIEDGLVRFDNNSCHVIVSLRGPA